MPQIPFPKRRAAFDEAPLADLLGILLRQYRRPLAALEAGPGGRAPLALSDADCDALAAAIVARAHDPRIPALRANVAYLLAESARVLGGWGLTFAQALETPVERLAGWETTADFLTLASEKSNAELRIAAGAALLVAMGDRAGIAPLLARIGAAERDPATDDLDAAIARRALIFTAAHHAHFPADAPDALARARQWAVLATQADVPPRDVL
jgi:hypothetical protein